MVEDEETGRKGCIHTLAVMQKTLRDVDNLDWQEINQILVETAKEVFGETSGKGTYTEKETWWWQEETRKAVALKRATFKQFQMNKSDENKEKCREANRASRKAVRIAKDAAYEDLYVFSSDHGYRKCCIYP